MGFSFLNAANLDEVLTAGFYNVKNCSNMPDDMNSSYRTNYSHILIVLKVGTSAFSDIIQILILGTSNTIYICEDVCRILEPFIVG